MTSPPIYPRRLYRDLAAVGLMLLGAAGAVTVTFLIHPYAGAMTLSAFTFAAGVYLGTDRGADRDRIDR